MRVGPVYTSMFLLSSQFKRSNKKGFQYSAKRYVGVSMGRLCYSFWNSRD